MKAPNLLAILSFSMYSISVIPAELTPDEVQYQEFLRIMDIEAGEKREIEDKANQLRTRSEKFQQLAVLCDGNLTSNSCLQKLALQPELEKFIFSGNISMRDLVVGLIRSQAAQN